MPHLTKKERMCIVPMPKAAFKRLIAYLEKIKALHPDLEPYQALQKNGADTELHLFPKGNHGFTQRLPVNEWLEPMLDFMKKEGMLK